MTPGEILQELWQAAGLPAEALACADLHGAEVAVRRSQALGGLAVRISLPAAPG